MSNTTKNVVAVIVGLIIGGVVNMGIINLGSSIISPPPGVDPSDIESIKAHTSAYSAIHFVIPFLAHALGTLVGAFLAVKLSASKKQMLAWIVAAFFALGGSMMAFMLPEFLKYSIFDLIFAYFPMAWIGGKLAGAGSGPSSQDELFETIDSK